MLYRRISEQLIEELAEAVMQGQSVALLAPRFGAKRYVLNHVCQRVKQAGLTPVVNLQFLDEQVDVINETDLAKQLRVALCKSGIEIAATAADPFEAIEQFAAQTGRRVTLFVANVDAIAHGVSRRLLKRIRKLVDARQLTAVLTGESDFQELVQGPNSEFTGSENYFLQGFAEAEFGYFLDEYVYTLGVELTDRAAIVHFLWQRTGGSSYLVRPLITEILEKKVKQGELLNSRPLTIEDFREIPRAKAIPGTYWTHLCRHATKMVSWESRCWDDLERLIREELVYVGPEPTPLEWTGIVVRGDDKRRLVFASELMKNYARSYYNDLHFGDLYMRHGQWEKAFERYDRLPLEQKRRPLRVDDRTETEKNLNAFGNALLSEAARGVEEVKQLFVQGCRHLLGFSEVTYWRLEDKWVQRPVHDVKPPVPAALQENVQQILADPGQPAELFFRLPEMLNEHVVAIKLWPFNSSYVGAVIVSDLAEDIAISRERRRLLKTALRQFAKAYDHAVSTKRTRRRLELREKQMELINSVFRAMGSQVLDVDSVLMRVGAGLAELGFQRVHFCLVDPQRKRIEGVLDYTRDLRRVDVAKMTDFALPDPYSVPHLDEYEDVQPYVVHTRQPFVTADARKERLCNKVVVEATEMTGLAIVPILNYLGEAIGTIHVERDDKLKPSQDEVDDLLAFGQLIATAIEQAERVNLLQTTLDHIPEPVAIVDSLERFRYANRPAAQELNVDSGWQERSEHGMPLSSAAEPIRSLVKHALDGERTFQHFRKGDAPQEDSCAILSDCIRDKKKRVVGAFLHLQELTDFYKVFAAFSRLAVCKDAEDIMVAMLEVAKLLGYQQGRLYEIDQQTGDLKSKSCYGMVDQSFVEKFERGEIVLPLKQGALQSRFSMENKTPMVFCFDPRGPNKEHRRTAQGLEYIVYDKTYLKRKPGEFWVDIPLLFKGGWLGKLTLPCDEYLRPERFELLKALSAEVDGKLFEYHVRNELDRYREEMELRASAAEQAAERVTADVAHNLATRFGSFPGYLELYRSYEEHIPELRELNDSFDHALTQAQDIVKRAKELLAPVSQSLLQLERLILPDFLERFFRSALPEGGWEIEGLNKIELVADGHRLEAAFTEILQNSKDAHAGPEPLQITVQIELDRQMPVNQVRLVYRDNGPGIPAEIRSRIFEDFFSFHRTRARGSSGLGMGFVKRVLKAHGGVIELGEPQQGVEFIITLPQRCDAQTWKEEAYVSHTAR